MSKKKTLKNTLIKKQDIKKENKKYEAIRVFNFLINKDRSDIMKGYGREVYITESDDIDYVKLNGKEYQLETRDYYDDETGNESYDFDLKDKKGKTIYSFSSFSNLDDFGKSCEQNIFIVDDNFLKELQKLSKETLPTQNELKAEELKKNLNDELSFFPFESLKQDKSFNYKSLKDETIGYVITENIKTLKEDTNQKDFKEKIVDEMKEYLTERIGLNSLNYSYSKKKFLENFKEELNVNIEEIEKKLDDEVALQIEKNGVNYDEILKIKKEEIERVFDEKISKIAYETTGRIKGISKENLEKEFSDEIKFYNEKDFKFKDELNNEKEKVFEVFRKNQEELVSYGISDTININIENLNKISPYNFSNEDIERLNKNYLEKNNLPDDKEYIDKIYNQHYIEEYKPLSIIDEYPEIKAEVLEKLPFDFGDVLPPFQVYNSNEMFYDSGTQEKSENLDNFMRSLVGDMTWDSMNIDNIMEWRKVSEDFPNVFNIIYFEKNDKGEVDDNSIKEFNSYDDYVEYSEKAIKEKLEDMLRHKPSLYKKIEEDVITTQKEAGVYKEKTFEKEINKKDELELKENKEIDFS